VTSGGKPVTDGNGMHAARHAAGWQAYAAEAELSP
jgi:hypothetical protein